MSTDLSLEPMTGEDLAYARIGLGMSQVEFADRLGMNKDSISKMERGGKVRLTIAFAVRYLRIVEERRRDRAECDQGHDPGGDGSGGSGVGRSDRDQGIEHLHFEPDVSDPRKR